MEGELEVKLHILLDKWSALNSDSFISGIRENGTHLLGKWESGPLSVMGTGGGDKKPLPSA